MRPTPESLAADINEQLGRRLTSVILYGSAASGDHVARHSDYNVLVVVDRTDPSVLEPLGPVLRRWTRSGNPLPQIMDRRFLARSADAFPLEWADMRDHHQVLHGADVLKGLRVSPRAMRIQLERELKAKLLRLHAAYAACADEPAALRNLLIKSSSTFQILFRGILRLKRRGALPPRHESAAALGRLLRIDLGVFNYLHALRTGEAPTDRTTVAANARQYLKAVEAVAQKMDSSH
jgi:hypothetical protein